MITVAVQTFKHNKETKAGNEKRQDTNMATKNVRESKLKDNMDCISIKTENMSAFVCIYGCVYMYVCVCMCVCVFERD